MDIHKPKPVHGWRDLLTEIGTIVVGVVIALAGEQAVELLHWRSQLAQARTEMQSELHASAYAAYERQVVAPCLSLRLARLRDELQSASADWPGDVLVQANISNGDLQPAYIAPWRQWTAQAYDALLASGTASHMKSKEMLSYLSVYSLIKEMRVTGDAEQEAVAQLADLATRMKLPEAAREGFMVALADARQDNRRARILADEMLSAMAPFKIKLSQAERDGVVADMQHIFGACAAARSNLLPPWG